jgi:hypothetical protein
MSIYVCSHLRLRCRSLISFVSLYLLDNPDVLGTGVLLLLSMAAWRGWARGNTPHHTITHSSRYTAHSCLGNGKNRQDAALDRGSGRHRVLYYQIPHCSATLRRAGERMFINGEGYRLVTA